MALDPISNELKDLKDVLTSRRILFMKMAILLGKGKLCEINRSISGIPIEASNKYSILPRPALFNVLFVVKLKKDLKYGRVMYISNYFDNTLYNKLLLI